MCKEFEGPVVIGEENYLNDFKPWKADWEKNINAKIHSGQYDRVNIPIWKIIKDNGEYKKKKISIEDMVHKRFNGSCVIRINDDLLGDLIQTITLEVGEILVKETGFTESHFKEYEIFRDFDSDSDSD